jgi:two-component system sensor histidine kinase BaeS
LDKKPTDLAALIEETVSAYAGQPTMPGVQITAEVEPALPMVNVDAGRIRQVLSNLLSNAVRHVPADGRVRVVARRVAGAVQVEVTDNGPGIPPDLLPHVFERFAKDPSSPGSGLGLAIARDLVEAHGGTIEAISLPGQGTTMRFRLPQEA